MSINLSCDVVVLGICFSCLHLEMSPYLLFRILYCPVIFLLKIEFILFWGVLCWCYFSYFLHICTKDKLDTVNISEDDVNKQHILIILSWWLINYWLSINKLFRFSISISAYMCKKFSYDIFYLLIPSSESI